MPERHCCRCVFAQFMVSRCLRDMAAGWPSPLMCINSEQAPGRPIEVAARSTCRNFRPRRDPVVRTDPPAPPNDEIRYIGLTRGKYAIVDTADYAWLNQWKWCVSPTGNVFYAFRKHHGKSLHMHQLIMKPPKGMVVDHINHNGLDNRRANLRICTQRQNAWNHGRRKAKNATSQFIGVHRPKNNPKKCYVRVTRNGKATNLGPFDNELEAAQARDRIARQLHGPYAYLNFPDKPPAERRGK